PQAERPEDAGEEAYRERLAPRRHLRVGECLRKAEAEGMGDREGRRHHQYVEHDAERGEDLVVPLEHGGAREYRERTLGASFRSLDEDQLRDLDLEAISVALDDDGDLLSPRRERR